MMRQLGGAFGLAIAVAVFTGAGSYASPARSATASPPPSRSRRRCRSWARWPGSRSHRRAAARIAIASRTAIPALEGGASMRQRDRPLQGQARPGGAQRGARPRRVRGARAGSSPTGSATRRSSSRTASGSCTSPRTTSPNPLPGIEAFRAFKEGIAERCEEPPVSSEMTAVGSYRFDRSAQQLTQRVDPVPHVDEPRRQRREAEPDHVGAAEVGDHAALDQPRAQALRVRVGERHVRAAASGSRGEATRDPGCEPLVGERDRELGQRDPLRADRARSRPRRRAARPRRRPTSASTGGVPDSSPRMPSAGT